MINPPMNYFATLVKPFKRGKAVTRDFTFKKFLEKILKKRGVPKTQRKKGESDEVVGMYICIYGCMYISYIII